MADRNGWH